MEVNMKKVLTILFITFLVTPFVSAQRIVFESNFENISIHPTDSIPTGWFKLDVDNNYPAIGWAVRDTSVHFGNGPTRPRAIGTKSLEIPWYAGQGGNNINDDWIFTSTCTAQAGDSLIWMMLIGSDSSYQPYLDSMQVYVCFDQDPGAMLTKLATIKSLDSAGNPLNTNDWTQHKYNLSSFAGQTICIAFRYNMDISVNGLWCNIDNVFIGNHSAIGIQQISSEVPQAFELKQNYPNPFNPVTNIEFSIAKNEFTSLVVYNSIGQVVATLVNRELKPGTYRYDFNASGLTSGTYFYRLSSGDYVKTNKMILVK
jgi:hypothetical protein